MGISARDVNHIFENLRKGVVPERGLETFAVGIDQQRTEIHRQLELADHLHVEELVYDLAVGGRITALCGKAVKLLLDNPKVFGYPLDPERDIFHWAAKVP